MNNEIISTETVTISRNTKVKAVAQLVEGIYKIGIVAERNGLTTSADGWDETATTPEEAQSKTDALLADYIEADAQ